MTFPIITIKNYIRLSPPPPCHGHKIRFQQRGDNKKLSQPDQLIQGEEIVMRKIDFGATQASKELEMVFPLSSNNRRSEPRLIRERQFPAKSTHNNRKTGIKNARGGNWSFQITTGTERKTRIRSAITVTAEGSRERGGEREECLIVGVIALENYSRRRLCNNGGYESTLLERS